MSDDNVKKPEKTGDRRLGDEWADWNGEATETSADTAGRVFVGLAIAAVIVILGAIGLFGWLIYPRLNEIGPVAGLVFNSLFFGLAAILLLWLLLFIWGSVTRRPFLSGLVVVPKLVNLLLELTIGLGKVVGISRDRLANSFLKLHNLFLDTGPRLVGPERMLILIPRCLSRDCNIALRKMRDLHGFILAVAEGGSEARKKIAEIKPRLIIAIACERDLLTGFIDVNPHIPVIGFPNIRPCGPCKNTEVDLGQIEATVKRHLMRLA